MTKIRALQNIEKYLQMFQNIHLYLLVVRMHGFFPDLELQYHCKKHKLKFRKINLIYWQEYRYSVSCCIVVFSVMFCAQWWRPETNCILLAIQLVMSSFKKWILKLYFKKWIQLLLYLWVWRRFCFKDSHLS